MMVQGRLKGAMTRQAAFRAVSAMYMGVICLARDCELSSMLNMLNNNICQSLCILLIFSTSNSNLYPMNPLDSIRCHQCSHRPQDFLMLSCNHVICGQCLSSFSTPQQSIISVHCSCGITSNILRQVQSRESVSTCLLSQKSLPILKPREINKQILDQTQFELFNASVWNSLNNQTKSEKKIKPNNKQFGLYLVNQLGNQLKFMELRYKRHINQINRYFHILIDSLNKKYQQTQKSLFAKCSNLIQIDQIRNLNHIQLHIQKAYKPKLEKYLMKISKQISNALKNLNQTFKNSRIQTQKQNYNSNNQFKSKKNETKRPKNSSSHDLCKKQQIYSYLSMIKSNKQQSNKIVKKRQKSSKKYGSMHRNAS